MKLEREAGNELLRLPVLDAAQQSERPLGIFHRVQGFDRRFAAFTSLATLVLGVFLVEVARIGQHDFAESARRVLDPDGPVVTLADQSRQSARVVDMRVAQDHGVDVVDGHRERVTVA